MGRDKSLLPYDGRAMASLVASSLAAAGCDPVVAIGGDGHALAQEGLHCVPDQFPGEGPLGGVITALRHFQDRDVVMVVACDLPELTAATIRAVIDALEAAEGAQVAMPITDRLQPMCGAWRTSAIAAATLAFESGERQLRSVARQLRVVEVSGVNLRDLANVNAPGDMRH